MEELPSNSYKKKEPAEQQKPAKIVTGEVIQQKKPIGRRFHDVFVGGDSSTVWGSVLLDHVIPSSKNIVVDAGQMFADAAVQFLERKLFGDAYRPGSAKIRRPAIFREERQPRIAYESFSGSRHKPDPRGATERPMSRSVYDVNEIVIPYRGEAEGVLEQMYDILGRYEFVRVADLKSLVGISDSPIDNKWGWTTLKGSGVDRVRNGYLLRLPRPEPLD